MNGLGSGVVTFVILRAIVLLVLSAGSAYAQAVDPRVAPQTIEALQAMLNLRDAQLKALQEDNKKKMEELKGLCGEPCKDK